MKTSLSVIFIMGLCWLGGGTLLWAVDDKQAMEDSLFSEAGGASSGPVLIATPEAKTVGFSGSITSVMADQLSSSLNANTLYSYTVADVYLDARLPQQAKMFANLEATYLSQNQLTQVALQELFLDFNFAQTLYVRTGKQVLQWGRCNLWNPTDLINIEKPHFVRKIGTREGAYGIKLHVPFGTVVNIYDFIDTGNALDAESAANALKCEVLLGTLEVGFSGWGKKGQTPVWGLDFSTRILGIDTMGEVSVSQNGRAPRMTVQEGQLTLETQDPNYAPSASLDLSRSFTVGDFKDRLTITAEGYYNRAGYDTNVLSDATDFVFAQPISLAGAAGPMLLTHGTQKEFISKSNLFAMNYFSRAYAALFTSFKRFILADMTCSLNYIQNLVDYSSLASLGLSYTELNGFTLGVLANYNLGKPDCEYTFSGEKCNFQLTVGIDF